MNKLVLLLTLISLTCPSWAQNVAPPNQSQTTSTRPTISANFNQRVRNPRIWVDGKDYTRFLTVSGSTVSLVPPNPLNYGPHQVKVTADKGVVRNWSFVVANNNNGNNRNNGNNGDYRNNNGYNNNGNNGNNGNTRNNNSNNNGNNGDYRNNNGYNNNGYNNGNNNNGNQGNSNGTVDVAAYGPSIGSVVNNPRPSIFATFNGTVQNITMTVDGRDVTREANMGNQRVSWEPRNNLNPGQHNARVTGTALNGQPVSGDWTFTISY